VILADSREPFLSEITGSRVADFLSVSESDDRHGPMAFTAEC
jgi:hypothetical protein